MSKGFAYEDPAQEEVHNGRPVGLSPRPGYNHNRISSNSIFLF